MVGNHWGLDPGCWFRNFICLHKRCIGVHRIIIMHMRVSDRPITCHLRTSFQLPSIGLLLTRFGSRERNIYDPLRWDRETHCNVQQIRR